MRIEMDQLGDDAHVWIFGISPALDSESQRHLLGNVDAFLDQWAAHKVPIRGARELQHGQFLVVAADPEREKSGCSIDRMFGTLRTLERDLGVEIIDSARVFFERDGAIAVAGRGEFRNQATPDTTVYDLTVETLGDVRSGRWIRPARDSWHRALLAT